MRSAFLLAQFVVSRLKENARLRRRSLPRRYVSIKGAAVLISFYGESP